MRWRVRKLKPWELPTEKRRWISAPTPLTGVGVRFHIRWESAIARALMKAYGDR